MKLYLMLIIALLLVSSGQAISFSVANGGGSASMDIETPDSASLMGQFTLGEGGILSSARLSSPGDGNTKLVMTSDNSAVGVDIYGKIDTEMVSFGGYIDADINAEGWQMPTIQTDPNQQTHVGFATVVNPATATSPESYKQIEYVMMGSWLSNNMWKCDNEITTFYMDDEAYQSMKRSGATYYDVAYTQMAAQETWDQYNQYEMFGNGMRVIGTVGADGKYTPRTAMVANGENTITFDTMPRAILATTLTTSYYDASRGDTRRAEFDIIYNSDPDIKWNFKSRQPYSNEYDFFTIATHEVGHAIGLDHSRWNYGVMRPSIGPGVRRSPSLGEIYFTQRIY